MLQSMLQERRRSFVIKSFGVSLRSLIANKKFVVVFAPFEGVVIRPPVRLGPPGIATKVQVNQHHSIEVLAVPNSRLLGVTVGSGG